MEVRDIKKMGQGNLKHFADFARFGAWLERLANQPDDRRDVETGDGFMAWQFTKDFDVGARQANFFFGFAQRRIKQG